MIKIYSETIETKALDQFHKAMSLPCNIQGTLVVASSEKPDFHTHYTAQDFPELFL